MTTRIQAPRRLTDAELEARCDEIDVEITEEAEIETRTTDPILSLGADWKEHFRLKNEERRIDERAEKWTWEQRQRVIDAYSKGRGI